MVRKGKILKLKLSTNLHVFFQRLGKLRLQSKLFDEGGHRSVDGKLNLSKQMTTNQIIDALNINIIMIH